MAITKNNLTLVVVRKDGRLHVVLGGEQIHGDPAETAASWASEGFTAFILGVNGSQWAVNHANSGRVMTSESLVNAVQPGGADITALIGNQK